jgi:hypothetical protein
MTPYNTMSILSISHYNPVQRVAAMNLIVFDPLVKIEMKTVIEAGIRHTMNPILALIPQRAAPMNPIPQTVTPTRWMTRQVLPTL